MRRIAVGLACLGLVWACSDQETPVSYEQDMAVGYETVPVSPEALEECTACDGGAAAKIAAVDPSVIFDQGPGSGSTNGCWANNSTWQNFAEGFSFPTAQSVDGIRIFTCIAPRSGTVHVKILDNSGANPGAYLYDEDATPVSWTSVPGVGYEVTVMLSSPFSAAANVTYWIGMAGNGFELGQLGVKSPDDGRMAQFNGPNFTYFTSVGDMMFQLLGPSNLPPDVSNAAPSTSEIWPPNNKMVDITIEGVTDPDGDSVTITVDAITNDESGTDDAAGIGTGSAVVEADRDGGGDGRVYTISFTASDGNGGESTGTVEVTVPHDQGKGKAKGRG